jgi:hypothetical protein
MPKFIVTYRQPEQAPRLVAVEAASSEAVLAAVKQGAIDALAADTGPFEIYGQRFDVEALMVWVPTNPVREAHLARGAELAEGPPLVRYEDSRGLMRRYVPPRVELLDDWFARLAQPQASRGSLEVEYVEFLGGEGCQ